MILAGCYYVTCYVISFCVIFNNFLIFLVAARSDNFSNWEKHEKEDVETLAVMCYVISFYVIFNT